MPSLGEFLHSLPSDDVLRIDRETDTDFVPSALAMELERQRRYPVLVFERPKGFDMPVVINLFSSRHRLARAIGTEPERFNDVWLRAEDEPIPPRVVAGGPCQEEIAEGDKVDLEALPISRHFEDDAGRYVSAGILVCKDPDTKTRNLSFQRLQLKGANRFGASLHSRGHIWEHLQRVKARGDSSLEVAVVIGAHPALYLAASAKVGMDVDELDIAGCLLGHPVDLVKCQTVDIEVPAHAEIVLEGEILTNREEPEGPFGEYTGYSTGRSTRNVLLVKAITRRSNALYQDLVPGNSSEHLLLTHSAKQAHVFERLREVWPSVRALRYPKSGTNFHAYLSVDQSDPGQVRHALMLLFGLDHYIKHAIAVDDDIDIFDDEQVLWAIATRVQADRDVFVIPDVFCNRLDPSAEGGVSAKMGVDATRGSHWEGAKPIRSPGWSVNETKRILSTMDEGIG